MRFDRFTIKSQELIQNAQTLASTHGNQQIEPEHLLASMLDEEAGVARSVLKKLGVSGDNITSKYRVRGVSIPSSLKKPKNFTVSISLPISA